ncbi:MAG: hypothetical protein K2G44_06060 [Clostridia bacterium]|nr:hypothetical protein [Clostridia bacterium]
MILHLNVTIDPLTEIVVADASTISGYFKSKSMLIYLLCFPLMLIAAGSFLLYITAYGLFRGIYYFQDEDSDNIFWCFLDIDNLFLKILAGIFCIPLFIVTYILSLATSLELYILCWILGIISFGFVYPIFKLIERKEKNN